MRYLITTKGHEPYLTEWYISENCFNPELDMIVYDLSENKYTTDGIKWQEIVIDHL